MNKNIFKKWWFWAIVMLCLLIFVPLTINFLFRNYFGVEWLVAEWTAGDALLYVGTILGAGATICAVILTISYSRKTFRLGLEKERKEKWLSDAKELFEYAAISFSLCFFMQHEEFKGIDTGEKARKRMVEVDNKQNELLEIFLKFRWLFAIAPIAKSSNVQEFHKVVDDAVNFACNEWDKVANAEMKYYKLRCSINPNDTEITEALNDYISKMSKYNEIYGDVISPKFVEQIKTLKIIIDKEIQDLLI